MKCDAVTSRGSAPQVGRRSALKIAGAAGLAAAPLMVGAAGATEAKAAEPRGAGNAPRTMRLAQMSSFRGPIEVVDHAVLLPRRDGAIVRVEASGICRSDWHWWNHDLTWLGITSQEERGQVSLPLDILTMMELEVVGSLGNPHPQYAELLALVGRGKLDPARLVTRQVALGDITDTLQRMTSFDTVGFEVITRFT